MAGKTVREKAEVELDFSFPDDETTKGIGYALLYLGDAVMAFIELAKQQKVLNGSTDNGPGGRQVYPRL